VSASSLTGAPAWVEGKRAREQDTAGVAEWNAQRRQRDQAAEDAAALADETHDALAWRTPLAADAIRSGAQHDADTPPVAGCWCARCKPKL
jgi:hypothetical protein